MSFEREQAATPTLEKKLTPQFAVEQNAASGGACSNSDDGGDDVTLPKTPNLVVDLQCAENEVCNTTQSSCELTTHDIDSNAIDLELPRSSIDCAACRDPVASSGAHAQPEIADATHCVVMAAAEDSNSVDLQINFNTSLHIDDTVSHDSTADDSTQSASARRCTACAVSAAAVNTSAMPGGEPSTSSAQHATPSCGSQSQQFAGSPDFLPLNTSPIGGMSHFRVDAPTTRYIRSGVKIDFQSSQSSNDGSMLGTDLQPAATGRKAPQFGEFAFTKQVQPGASTPTGKKTFTMFDDYAECSDVTNNAATTAIKPEGAPKPETVKAVKSTVAPSSKDSSSRSVASEQTTTTKKKRRSSESLGNDNKKQIM